MKTKLQKIIISSMFASLCCVATMIIRVPSPLGGYINLGDVIVLACAFLLPCTYGFCAAAIGSALADVFAGYMVYVPATFVIKGLMVVCACFCFKALHKKMSKTLSRTVSGVLAEIIMVGGYLVYESFLYGFSGACVNILPNVLQGVAGVLLAVILTRIFDSTKIFDN